MFNHKAQVFKQENANRRQSVDTVVNSILALEHKLAQPQNYRQFFWTPDYNVYGFGTLNEIKTTTDAMNCHPPTELFPR